MADLEKTIEIIFKGTDNISSKLAKMSKKVDSFGSDIQDIGQPFADATEKVALLNIAIAGIAAAGIKASSDIEAEATKMQNSLGLPIEEAERFEEVAKDVYKSGLTKELTEAFEVVTLAQKKFGDNASVDVGKVSEEALKIKKVFGTEVNESLSAARTLMKNFGLDSDEAFDFIVTGFQKGLNSSGDFLESVTEYSNQFAEGGADAGEFFSIMETGLADGLLGTDKAADAFKEFRVRVVDDSKLTREALENLGFDPDEFAAKLASGELSAVDAFGMIQEAIVDTEDKRVAFNAGVGLMGTQFEDLGDTAVRELDITKTSIEDLSGAMDDLDPGGFEVKFQEALNTVKTEFGDMTQWDDAKDNIIEVFSDIAESLGPALDNADFSGLEDSVGEVWDNIASIFTDNDLDLTTIEGMENAIQLIVDSLESTADVTAGIIEILDPAVDAMIAIANTFNDMDPGMKELAGNLLGVGTALTTIGGVVVVGGALLGGLSTLAGLVASGGSLVAGAAAFALALTGPVGLVAGLGALGIAAGAVAMGPLESSLSDTEQYLLDNQEKVDELVKGLNELDTTTATAEIWAAIEEGSLEEAERMLDEAAEEERVAKLTAQVEQEEFAEFTANLADIPEEIHTEIIALMNQGKFDEVEQILDDIGEGKEVTIEAKGENIDTVKEEIVWFDEDGKRHTIEVDVEDTGVDETKQKVEDIPTEKQIEIKIQGDIDTQIANIEAQAETAQAGFEWTAKVNIAEAEAAAAQVEAAFDSVTGAVDATASAASDMFGPLTSSMSDLSPVDKWAMQDVLEDQMEMEQQALDTQKKLVEAQVKLMEAKADAVEDGDGLIKIDSSGLEPALEMVMWQILEKVQIRANESSSDFLLGV